MCIVAVIYLDFIAESFERPIISRKLLVFLIGQLQVLVLLFYVIVMV